MFFDNINGTSGGTGDSNSNNDNDKYDLKNVSLRQGRAFLKDEKKLNRTNTYLAQNTGNSQIVGMNIEGFDDGQQQPEAVSASASASSAPEAVSLISSGEPGQLDKMDDAFDSKMAAYSSALSEFNKELLKSQNYFVVPVKSLMPINSCFNCDASLGGTDCAAMGVSNSNGDIRTALPNSTSPTANLLPCVVSGVTVPGWGADPNDSSSCMAPLGQKCCNMSIYNGQPVCITRFGLAGYKEKAMNDWVGECITPPPPEEITQKITLANEHCQGNGISLNYWSQNANNFVLVTTQEPANDAGVPYNNIRPFAKMNSIPVWMCNLGDPSGVNFFSNLQDANKAKSALVFSPTVEKMLSSAREDMMNAATGLIKAVSSQQSTTAADRKAIEQKISAVRSKISKLDSQKQMLDNSADANSISLSLPSLPSLPSSSMKESFVAQEEDTRIQFKSRYAYYTVWFVIAIVLIVVIFSSIFYTDKGGEGGESSSSSTILIIGVLMVIVFVYFIIQYLMVYFNVSNPRFPFNDFNPLL
uniref:Uncharacterized protein n=1 Tax=viral metagenome TaxID=1070528 RepID=A0A6C0F3D6_9ZZZZ